MIFRSHSWIIIFLFLLCLGVTAHAQKLPEEYEGIFQKVDAFLKDHPIYEGTFTIQQSGQPNQTGNFYCEGIRFKLVFGGKEFQASQRIIFTGTRLWMYDPGRNLVIDQDIDDPIKLRQTGQGGMISTSTLGLRTLLLDFNIDLKESSSQLKQTKQADMPVYILSMAAKHNQQQFQRIVFYIQENGFIMKTQGVTKHGKTLSFTRSNLSILNKQRSDGFTLHAPEDAWIIKNPILSDRTVN